MSAADSKDCRCGCCGPGCRCQGPTGGGPGADGGTTGQGGGLPPGWRPVPQGTWLLIRYDTADVGARPVPNGEVFWESPDIQVIGGDAFGNPTAGKPVGLEARVWNQGDLDAAPVRVDFFFIAPSLGITTGAPQLIGTAWTTLLAGHSRVVTCPTQWTPPEYPTNLHACVIVTCSAPAQHDAPTAPANPALDRHVGQRNLTVLEGKPGTADALQLGVTNLAARRAPLGIVVAAEWLADKRLPEGPSLMPSLGALATTQAATRAQDLSESRLWAKRAALLDVQARAAPGREAIAKPGEIVRVESLRRSESVVSPTAISLPRALSPHVGFLSLRREVDLEPGQTATAKLALQLPAQPQGAWLAIHLAQSQDGQLTGGYTVRIRTAG
jgi:hypothetical protein